MGKNVTEILAENLNRLIGPGMMCSSNEAAAARSRVGRSTIDRARKAQVSIKLDNLGELATSFKLEPWQLLIAGLDPENPPTLESTAVVQEGITKDEANLLSIFRSLGEPERTYLLQQAETYKSASSPKKSMTRVKGAA